MGTLQKPEQPWKPDETQHQALLIDLGILGTFALLFIFSTLGF